MKPFDPLFAEMFAAGYQRTGSASEVTPMSSGIPEPKWPLKVDCLVDRIRIYETKFFGEPFTQRCYTNTVTVAVFDDVASYLAWCVVNGRLSEPGLPPFAQGMD